VAERILHGLIQRAEQTARDIPYRVEPSDPLNIEKWHKGKWRFVCRCESEEHAEDFLVGKLKQEGER